MIELVGYRSTNKAVYSAKHHIIWCPKYRRRVLVNGVDERLKEIIAAVVGELGGTAIEVEVMPDHRAAVDAGGHAEGPLVAAAVQRIWVVARSAVAVDEIMVRVDGRWGAA